jgi:hypothetical protein
MPPSDTCLPRSIERILADAANDDEFREHLLRDRLEATRSRGYELTETEKAILLSVPEAQLLIVLSSMPEGVRPPDPGQAVQVPMAEPAGIRPNPPVKGIRPGRVVLAAAATAAVAGGAVTLCSMGVRPDRPDATQPASLPDSGPSEDGGAEGNAGGSPDDPPDERKR